MSKIKIALCTGFAFLLLAEGIVKTGTDIRNESFFFSGLFTEQETSQERLVVVSDEDDEITFDFAIFDLFKKIFGE